MVRLRLFASMIALATAVMSVAAACGVSIVGETSGSSADNPSNDPASASGGGASSNNVDAAESSVVGVNDDGGNSGDPGDADASLTKKDATSATPPFCDQADTTLLLCMPFENNALDESKHQQQLSVAGVNVFSGGKRGQAITMTSATAIHLNDSPLWSYTDLTFEAWIRPSSLPSTRFGLIDKDLSFGIFLLANGNIACNVGAYIEVTAMIKVDTWTHVACTSGGGTATVYINGANIASSANGNVPISTALTAVGGNSPSGDPFIGQLDSVRVYTRKKTQSEIELAAK